MKMTMEILVLEKRKEHGRRERRRKEERDGVEMTRVYFSWFCKKNKR